MWNPMMFNNAYNPQMYNNGYNQPMQNIQQVNTPAVQKQASCYFVKTADELSGVNIMPNTYYLGINRDNNEIYVRRMNNDGIIEAETYVKASEKKEKSEMQNILECLKRIENKITPEVKDVSTSNVAV
jgi:hypothetical protein